MSYEHLRTVAGVTHATFQAACTALGLLNDDRYWERLFEEWTTACIPA